MHTLTDTKQKLWPCSHLRVHIDSLCPYQQNISGMIGNFNSKLQNYSIRGNSGVNE